MAKLDQQLEKCQLKGDDGGCKTVVTALFNPKELSLSKSVPWQEQDGSKGNSGELEFSGAKARSMSLELFFDTYEEKKNVYDLHISPLLELSEVMSDPKRPPKVVFTWGKFPRFVGVIESCSVKYTMFLADGTPVRATASVKLKEATKGLSVKS